MAPSQDRLTLDALLNDPLTQLVMRSDGITQAEVAQAFAMAWPGVSDASPPPPVRRGTACTTFGRWLGAGNHCRMG